VLWQLKQCLGWAVQPQKLKAQSLKKEDARREQLNSQQLEAEGQDTMEQQGGRLIRLDNGLPPQEFGEESRVAAVNIHENEAVLIVDYQVAGIPRSLWMPVCSGDIVPIGKNLHRVARVHYIPYTPPPGHTGGSQSHVLIGTTPIEQEGFSLHEDSLAIPLETRTGIAGYYIEVLKLADSTAKVETWPVGMAKSHTKPEQIHSHLAKAGNKLTLDSAQLNILSVVPSNPQTGLRGFIEIGF